MPLSFGPKSRIHAVEVSVTLHGHSRHVIKSLTQARITTATHHHQSALATLPRHRGHPAMRAQHFIVPFGQRLGGFGTQPGPAGAFKPKPTVLNKALSDSHLSSRKERVQKTFVNLVRRSAAILSRKSTRKPNLKIKVQLMVYL
jgi:hypothetical protein